MRKLAIILMTSAAGVALAPAAQAADLAAPLAPPPVVAPVAAPATDWSGPYAGANIGYGWGTVDTDTLGSVSPAGGSVGAQVGYNFYLSDGVVLGLQGDVNWNNLEESNGTFNSKTDWTGAITGRLGFAWDAVMPYVLGGVAFANNEITSGGVSESQTHTGWTVGAGAEVMLVDNLSAFAEYRYSDYGARDYTSVAGATGVHPKDNSVRAGLNFHF